MLYNEPTTERNDMAQATAQDIILIEQVERLFSMIETQMDTPKDMIVREFIRTESSVFEITSPASEKEIHWIG